MEAHNYCELNGAAVNQSGEHEALAPKDGGEK